MRDICCWLIGIRCAFSGGVTTSSETGGGIVAVPLGSGIPTVLCSSGLVLLGGIGESVGPGGVTSVEVVPVIVFPGFPNWRPGPDP